MNVRKLEKRIAAELQPDEGGELDLFVHRDWCPDPSRGLRRTTVDELLRIHGELSKAIPNDFDFCLSFAFGDYHLDLIFNDGLHSGARKGLPCDFTPQGFSRLAKMDWDAIRSESMLGTQIHEKIVDAAEGLPGGILSTEQLQALHADRFEEFQKGLKDSKLSFAILCCPTDEDGIPVPDMYEVYEAKGRDSLIGELSNLLTCECHVIAIVVDGRLLSPDESDSCCSEAVSQLGPISRSKAEGRFYEAAGLMFG